ncbi:MAG: hypothetical protein FJ249_05820 [Nitrospira sp.]|nr:hypothetical protein [Nitrospira sp.]
MDNREKTWHGLRAASLSLVAGMGHLYLGEKRGYAVLAFGLALLIIARSIWPPAELLYLSLAIVSAFDAYSIAKRGHGLM